MQYKHKRYIVHIAQDRRKHYKQMTMPEILHLKQQIVSIGEFEFSKHVMEMMKQRNMPSKKRIQTAIKYGMIIEANNNVDGDFRVLLRFNPKWGEESFCVVVSLTDKEIVTFYCNPKTDKHQTIDWDKYKWNANMITECERLLQK